jgi:hypothetical protein
VPQDAYGEVFPFEGDQEAGDAAWRLMAKAYGDGIVNDVDGTSFKIASKSGSDRSFVMNLGELRVQGINFHELDPTIGFTPAAPSATKFRIDRINAVYDPDDESINIVLDQGAEAASAGAATPPALVRDPDDTWALPLWTVRSASTGTASGFVYTDCRQWLGATYLVANAGALDPDAPIGSTALNIANMHRYSRQLVVSTPTWVDLDAVVWTPVPSISPRVAFGIVPQYAKVGGFVVLKGAWANAASAPFNSGGSYGLGQLPVGFRPLETVSLITDHGFSSTAIALRVTIAPDGTMLAEPHGTTTIIQAGNIRFPAEA